MHRDIHIEDYGKEGRFYWHYFLFCSYYTPTYLSVSALSLSTGVKKKVVNSKICGLILFKISIYSFI